MNTTISNTLRVPGATLSYQVRGEGPILLLLSGGGNDSHAFDVIARDLIDQYSIVTYDRRGLSRSTLDDPEEEQLVETNSDDAHRLLKELGSDDEPAYVFGSSGGAIIGLDLVARHPNQIYTLIAHEPPTHLLSEADPVQEMEAVREVYRREGLMAALQKLMALPGMSLDGYEMDIPAPAPVDRDQLFKNMTFLFEHEFAMYDRYQLDFVALKQAMTQSRIVLAGGRDCKESSTYRSAAAVADRLGTRIVDFPGRHIGYVTNPSLFARHLCELLNEKAVR